KWSQQDYWGLAAFFTRVDVQAAKAQKIDGKTKKVVTPATPLIVLHKTGRAETIHPRTKQKLKPASLRGTQLTLAADDAPRGRLAVGLTQPDNPYFARTLVNRYWKHFMGRGLVEPEDDMRATNPPTNPELLDALAKQFADSKFDLKALVRAIATSRAY